MASPISHNIKIICFQEHRYTHNEDIKYNDIGNEWMLATSSARKKIVNATIGDVVNSIQKTQLKMMVGTFDGNSRATIISRYSPTNVSEGTDLIIFYDELSSLVRNILKHDVLVIGGDMKVQIVKNVEQIQPTQLVKQK